MAETWNWPKATVVSVYDGDTFRADVDLGRRTFWLKGAVRLAGINANELRDPGGIAARDYLRQLLPVGTEVELQSVGYDKYQDRVDAIVKRKSDGMNINEEMVLSGNAIRKDYS